MRVFQFIDKENEKNSCAEVQLSWMPIIVPASDCGLTIEEIILKDVPFNKPFKIVDVNDIPSDRTFRSAWEVDVSNLTDGFGAEYNTIPELKE